MTRFEAIEYHIKHLAENPKWSIMTTASVCQVPLGELENDLKMAHVLALLSPERRVEIYNTVQERDCSVKDVLSKIVKEKETQTVEKHTIREKRNIPVPPYEDQGEVHACEAVARLREVPDGKVDLVITNPPQRDVDHPLIIELDRVLSPGGFLYLFCDMAEPSRFQGYHDLVDIYFPTRPTPLYWCIDKPGITSQQSPYWPWNTQHILVACKGMGRVNSPARTDFFVHSPANPKRYPHEIPIPVYEWLIKRHAQSNGYFLDPFCSGGNSLIAARRHWFHILGMTEDEGLAKIAREGIHEWDQEVMNANGLEAGTQMLEKIRRW